MTTTEQANAIIQNGASQNRKDVVLGFLRDAAAWRPLGFAATQKRRRDHLQGRATPYIREQLKGLFEKTYKKIPILPFNWAKVHSATAAAFYDEHPKRDLIDPTTEKELEPTDPRVKAFAELQKQTRSDVKLPKGERRSEWMDQVVVAVRVRQALNPMTFVREPCVRFELHYADACWVLPDPEAPTDLQMAHGFALEVRLSKSAIFAAPPTGLPTTSTLGVNTSSDPSAGVVDRYEFWTRGERPEDPWIQSFETVSRDSTGKVNEITSSEPVTYDGKMLPFVIMRNDDPDAGPWVERGDDDLNVVELLQADASDELWLGLMQAHTDRVYKGNRNKGEMVGGPDQTHVIDTGEELVALDYNPKLEARRSGVTERTKTWALTERHNLDSYDVNTDARPESGIAKAIRNEPQDKMRREKDVLRVECEEHELWPCAMEAWSLFVQPKRDLRGLRVRCTPRRREPYEDMAAKQTRLLLDLAKGVISLAQYAVEMGHYDSIDAAKAAGISDELKEAPAPPAPGAPGVVPGSFAARMTAAKNGAPPADPNAQPDKNAPPPKDGKQPPQAPPEKKQ